jgi:hypothetical protein
VEAATEDAGGGVEDGANPIIVFFAADAAAADAAGAVGPLTALSWYGWPHDAQNFAASEMGWPQ